MIDLSLFYTVDEEGNELELPRPETKSWADVLQVINHHKGQNDPVVKRFIELYLLGIQWDWFEYYKKWLLNCESVQAWNDARTPDEEGNLSEPMPLPAMPERPEAETVAAVMRREYRLLRKAAYGEPDSQFHEVFDTSDHGVSHRDLIKAQYPK